MRKHGAAPQRHGAAGPGTSGVTQMGDRVKGHREVLGHERTSRSKMDGDLMIYRKTHWKKLKSARKSIKKMEVYPLVNVYITLNYGKSPCY